MTLNLYFGSTVSLKSYRRQENECPWPWTLIFPVTTMQCACDTTLNPASWQHRHFLVDRMNSLARTLRSGKETSVQPFKRAFMTRFPLMLLLFLCLCSWSLPAPLRSGSVIYKAIQLKRAPQDASLVAFTGWAIMVLREVAALRLTLPLVRAVQRAMNVWTTSNIGTNFNPLRF